MTDDGETTVLDDLPHEEFVIRGAATGALPTTFSAPIDTDNARLERARLSGLDLNDVRWRMTSVVSADLSGVRWDGARLVDVVFEDCDLTGMQMLGRSSLDLVTFTRCKLSYTNWFEAAFDRVRFVDCALREARFASAQLSEVVMHGCDAAGASFERITLEEPGDLDLRGSRIDDTTGLAAIRGLRVDTTQAAALGASLLEAAGIVVDDSLGDPGDSAQSEKPRR